jgi:hypothetical protein
MCAFQAVLCQAAAPDEATELRKETAVIGKSSVQSLLRKMVHDLRKVCNE